MRRSIFQTLYGTFALLFADFLCDYLYDGFTRHGLPISSSTFMQYAVQYV